MQCVCCELMQQGNSCMCLCFCLFLQHMQHLQVRRCIGYSARTRDAQWVAQKSNVGVALGSLKLTSLTHKQCARSIASQRDACQEHRESISAAATNQQASKEQEAYRDMKHTFLKCSRIATRIQPPRCEAPPHTGGGGSGRRENQGADKYSFSVGRQRVCKCGSGDPCRRAVGSSRPVQAATLSTHRCE